MTSAILKVVVVCDVAMTSTPIVLTTELRELTDLLYTHPVNYVYMQTVSIRLHVKVALRISSGGIAKRRGILAMCVGYHGKVLIPLWFVHEDTHLVDKTT